MNRPTLSVIIITKNEAALIERCLKSVIWADEIIILDSGSTDQTVAICKQYKALVNITDWPGYGPQKNRALEMATGDWILSIDADETVSAELAKEIQNTIQLATPAQQVFLLKRLSSLMGKPMRHGDWWPDQIPRLFRRGKAKFTNDLVHERLEFNVNTETLKNLLIHDSIRSIEQMIQKMNQYTSAGAQKLLIRKKTGGLRKAILHGGWAVLRSYIIKRGFLDGREGLIAAISAGESAYYKYLKAYYKNE